MEIFLEKGEVLCNEIKRVVCETGVYEPTEMVLVGDVGNPIYPPDFPLYQYPAYYIKYGVYYETVSGQT